MLQCDASQSGLGVVLLQQGQPIVYASRALTSAETLYAQIKKELFAILFDFDIYLYGRGKCQNGDGPRVTRVYFF